MEHKLLIEDNFSFLNSKNILKYWEYEICLQKKIYLKDIFSIDSNTLRTIGYLTGNNNIVSFLKKDFKNLNEQKCLSNKKSKIKKLKLSKNTNITLYNKKKIFSSLENYISFIGIDKQKNSMSIVLSNWNELKNYPIVLDKTYLITIYDDKFLIKDRFIQKTTFTVREFFKGIFDELCFFKNVKERNKLIKSLKIQMKKLKNNELKLYSWDEIKKEFKE